MSPEVKCKYRMNLDLTITSFTYMLSSKQILGPTTLAAPLAILKEKCPTGQGLDTPHLYLGALEANKENQNI